MTYCVAVEAELTVRKCPLDVGRCMWQHRQTHECCHSVVEMSVQEFCQNVGLKGSPSEAQVGRFMIKLREVL